MKQLNTFLTIEATSDKDELPFTIATLESPKDNQKYQGKYVAAESRFAVVFITGGTGSLLLDPERVPVTDTKLLVLKRGDLNRLKLTNGLRGYVVSFTPSFFDASDHGAESLYENVYRVFDETRFINISDDAFIDISEIMEIMWKEFTRHDLSRGQVLKRYFKVFLFHLSGQFKTLAEASRQPRNSEILHNFMALLEKYFRVKKMVADYADLLSVTPNYLNEVIKKLTGVSAGSHIRKRIALEAKRQAVYSNTCMKNIAYDLGFLDLAHFSKFFKNTTGTNFSDFKKNGAVLQPFN